MNINTVNKSPNKGRGNGKSRLISFFMKKIVCAVTGYKPATVAQYQSNGLLNLSDIDSVSDFIKKYFNK